MVWPLFPEHPFCSAEAKATFAMLKSTERRSLLERRLINWRAWRTSKNPPCVELRGFPIGRRGAVQRVASSAVSSSRI